MRNKWSLITLLLCVGSVFFLVFFVFAPQDGEESLYDNYLQINTNNEGMYKLSNGAVDEYVERMKEAIGGNTLPDSTQSSTNGGGSNSNISYSGEGITAEGVTAKVDPASDRGKVIAAAFSMLGCPYQYGAAGGTWNGSLKIGNGATVSWTDSKYSYDECLHKPCYDCSGFTMTAYKKGIGKDLPRVSGAQCSSAYGAKILSSTAEMKPGDLAGDGGHVVMYIGDGNIIEAPSTGKTVRIIAIKNKWSSGDFPGSYTRVSYLD